MTNVIAAYGNVTITQERQPPARIEPRPAALALPATTEIAPQTAIELAEECARLRRDNQRLSSEAAWLRSEVDRLSTSPTAPRQRETLDLDDAAKRFSLLELE